MSIVPDDRSTPIYRYYVAWTISGDLALELSFSGVTWSRQIRRAGSFSGTVSFGTDDTRLAEAYWGTMPGKMSIFVTRNGRPVWGGIIARRSYDPESRTLQVEATGFESYLYRRFIWVDTVQSLVLDQYQVVRNLIGMMQTDFLGLATNTNSTPHPDNANIGILVDPSMSGKHQDTQIYFGDELSTFGDAIEAMSDNLWGFEYNIEVDFDPDANSFIKKLVFRDTPPSQYPNGVTYTGTRPGLEENFFEYPGNVHTIGYEDSLDDSSTRYWVAGAQPPNDDPDPEDDIEPIELPRVMGSWPNEAYFSTQWPIVEVVDASNHSSVTDPATCQSYASTYGRRFKPPIPAWSVTVDGSMNPQVGTYGPGDWCSLVVTDPFLVQGIESDGTVSRIMTKRIQAFQVSVPDTNQIPETVQLTLIDEWTEGT